MAHRVGSCVLVLSVWAGAAAAFAQTPMVVVPRGAPAQTAPASAQLSAEALYERQPLAAQQRLSALARQEPFANGVVSETTRAALGGVGADADVETLAWIVMMLAAREANEDMKSVMGQIRDQNSRCASLRQSNTALARASAVLLRRQGCAEVLRADHPLRTATLARVREAGEDAPDQLELSEEQALRLQALLDRRSRALEALSNQQRRRSETAAAIVGNQK